MLPLPVLTLLLYQAGAQQGPPAQCYVTAEQMLRVAGKMAELTRLVKEQQEMMHARACNERVRAHNRRDLVPGAALRRVLKEQMPAAGGATPGTLPPPIFPADKAAVQQMTPPCQRTVPRGGCAALGLALGLAPCASPAARAPTEFGLPCLPTHAALQLTAAQLDQLEEFYEISFKGADGEQRCCLPLRAAHAGSPASACSAPSGLLCAACPPTCPLPDCSGSPAVVLPPYITM
jgi:hypothetical protein